MMKKKQMYKLGRKVRHRTSKIEGYITHSSSGVSVNGYYYENGEMKRFHTLSMTMKELKENWKRIYKFKYYLNVGGDINE